MNKKKFNENSAKIFFHLFTCKLLSRADKEDFFSNYRPIEFENIPILRLFLGSNASKVKYSSNLSIGNFFTNLFLWLNI